ncbi:MAG: hypothetical protein IPK94_08445 [Saprospiraceae bacterium]|nr:hypothetical protein [Saprospiraceae bacterium]
MPRTVGSIGEDDVCALPSQAQCHVSTQSSASAGVEGNFVFVIYYKLFKYKDQY